MKAVNGGLHHQAQILLARIFDLCIPVVKKSVEYGSAAVARNCFSSAAVACITGRSVADIYYGGAVDRVSGPGIERRGRLAGDGVHLNRCPPPTSRTDDDS